MKLLSHIKIQNFKCFGEEQRIDLEHPSVIIGPNNSGKTSVLHALVLWSNALQKWCEERSNPNNDEDDSATLNRLSLVAVPVQRTRYFWHNDRVRYSFRISAGVIYQGKENEVAMSFDYFQGDDIILCDPACDADNSWTKDLQFLKYLRKLRVKLLYPMSGLEIEEAIYTPARVNTLLGRGRTAEVLRNQCLTVWENSQDEWSRIVNLLSRLFGLELLVPHENGEGTIVLKYKPVGSATELEISSAGRGFLQMLLVFTYLYLHKNSVLLIDEPDAHLEILRQKQVRVLLRDIAHENNSQVVMVTHSEVILNESLDENLTLLLEGKAENLAKKQDIRNSLKVFGAEHYLKARACGNVFYVDGSTDVDNLRELAKLLNHPVAQIWDDHRVNVYYIRHPYPEETLETELEHAEEGYGSPPKKHFDSLRGLLPGLKGLAVLDNDGMKRQNYEDSNLKIRYWERYEIENYFITPEVLRRYFEERFPSEDLFAPRAIMEEVLKNSLVDFVFKGRQAVYDEWIKIPPSTREFTWETATNNIKLSFLAETFFEQLAEKTNTQPLLRKGGFHYLVKHATLTSAAREEVWQKLDLLHELLSAQKSIDETSNT